MVDLKVSRLRTWAAKLAMGSEGSVEGLVERGGGGGGGWEGFLGEGEAAKARGEVAMVRVVCHCVPAVLTCACVLEMDFH